MPGRKYNSAEYRYGFNGKEKDDEGEFGSQTVYDYGMRIHNPAIGRFLSVDPLGQKYPHLTPYQYASNRPIDGIDLDGLEYFNGTGWNMIFREMESRGEGIYGRTLGDWQHRATDKEKLHALYRFVFDLAVVYGVSYTGPALGLASSTGRMTAATEVRYLIHKITPASWWRRAIGQKTESAVVATVRASKFDFFLGRLSYKDVPLSRLSSGQTTNLAKAKIRSEMLKKIGIDTEEGLMKEITRAYDEGKVVGTFDVTNPNTGEFVGSGVKKQIEVGGEKINVSFLTREGQTVPEVSTITIEGTNKQIKAEVKSMLKQRANEKASLNQQEKPE